MCLRRLSAAAALAVITAATMISVRAHAKGGYVRPPPIEDLTQMCFGSVMSHSDAAANRLASECGNLKWLQQDGWDVPFPSNW